VPETNAVRKGESGGLELAGSASVQATWWYGRNCQSRAPAEAGNGVSRDWESSAGVAVQQLLPLHEQCEQAPFAATSVGRTRELPVTPRRSRPANRTVRSLGTAGAQ